MIDKQMKNENGFALIELLIAMAIGIIVLGVAIFTYNKQDQLLRNENKNVQIRDFARLAMDDLTTNIRMAGNGFPPGDSTLTTPRPARGVTNADVTTITYRANTDGITTFVNFDSTSTTNKKLPVADISSFVINDHVVFFDVQTPTKWNTKTFESTSNIAAIGDFMEWGASVAAQNDFTFEPITDNVAVPVNKYHTIIYSHNAVAQTINVKDDMGTNDGGTDDTDIIMANNVSNLTFSYFDMNGDPLNTTLPLPAADLGNLRKIQISITVVDEDDDTVTTTLLTDITLRNMGI